MLTRRDFVRDAGLASVALSWMLGTEAKGGGSSQATHFPSKAKRVIQIFAAGGVSHLETFDYKPELAKQDGRELTNKGKIDTFFGQPGRLKRPMFPFQKRGESGQWVSD
jgi:hypothetical protein